MPPRSEQFKNIVSVIIPTLNAAPELPRTLDALGNASIIREIIVADGGSRDETARIAETRRAAIVLARRGRGTQLRAGAAAASGAWLLFLHADCVPLPGWEDAVTRFMAAPGATCRAGYFALKLDDEASAARRLERIVAWRCRALALPYGDQGLLIARALYDAVGGFAPIPLMEDVDLVRRLGRRRAVPIGAPVLASARRYRRDGYLRRSLRNLVCLGLYFAGVPVRYITRLYG
jgi:rSAM/selenodomain-associated transferase 2